MVCLLAYKQIELKLTTESNMSFSQTLTRTNLTSKLLSIVPLHFYIKNQETTKEQNSAGEIAREREREEREKRESGRGEGHGKLVENDNL